MIEINFTYVIQLFSFLLLLGLVSKFLYKPILKILDDRTKQISDSIDEALEAKGKATVFYDKCVTEFERVQKEALIIKEEAKSIGTAEKERLIAAASEETKNMLSQAKKEIDQQIGKAKEELKQDIGALAIAISEKIIKDELPEDKKKNIAEKYIKEIQEL